MSIAGTHFRRFGRLGAGGALAGLTGGLAEARGLEGQQRPPRELAAMASAAEWLNSPRADGGQPARKGRARRLLDLHLHQLAAHASVRSRLGAEVHGRGSS